MFFLLDVLFLPVVAALFIALLLRAGNTRNLKIGAVLALLGVANLVFHLAASGAVAIDPVRALYGALALIIVLETIMGGRVIPSFTMNVTPGLKLPRAPGATPSPSSSRRSAWPAGPSMARACFAPFCSPVLRSCMRCAGCHGCRG